MESLIGLDIRSFELIVCVLGFEFLKCLLHHIQAEAERNLPREYFRTCHISDYRKIAPLPLVWNVGDVGSEFPVWNIGLEFTIQNIRCRLMLLGCSLHHSVRILSTNHGEEMIFFHESVDFLVVHSLSFLTELHGDNPISVLFVEFQNELLYFFNICFLSFFFGRSFWHTFFPSIVSREWYPGNITECWNGMMRRKVSDDTPFLWSANLLFLFLSSYFVYLFLCARSNLKKSFSCSR